MSSIASSSPTAKQLLTSLLSAIEDQIIPLTREGVKSGSKLFGASILSKDLEPLVSATNNERVSPLFHGEIHCIHQFFTQTYPEPAARPDPAECFFLATHEPCSLCLSGITWSGFRRFFFLFTYEDSRDLFSIPYDIDILESVFRVRAPSDTDESLAARPLYNKTNKFFKAEALADLVEQLDDEQDKTFFAAEIQRVKAYYNDLSNTYQAGKTSGAETSSHFK
ncbi:hypothetical protein HOO65_010493 [Ceratocystis lukuohia]|uniref:CMP/dCMP-type deaminase domain-containing protein n=2 Tax=Ceratocystis TaxID=5157 RepID=A0A2C5WYL1_9PEZI|nr:hypothetical protein CFIMG_004117RA [Ceratocystis fimbriata CBS 114723]